MPIYISLETVAHASALMITGALILGYILGALAHYIITKDWSKKK